MKAKIITDRHTITIHSPHDEITIQLTAKGYFEHFMDEHKEKLRQSVNDIHEKEQQPKPEFEKGTDTDKKPEKVNHPFLPERTCPVCGNHFTPRRKDSTYCSKKCASTAYNKKHTEKKKATTSKHPAPGTMPSSKHPAPVAMPSSEPKAHYDPTVNPITGHRKD